MRRVIRPRRYALRALAFPGLVTLFACSHSGTSEKTATETFGCYVGDCVVAGEGPDDDAGVEADANAEAAAVIPDD